MNDIGQQQRRQRGLFAAAANAMADLVTDVGALVIDGIVELGSVAWFCLRTFRWLLTRLPSRGTLLPNFYQIGVLSLPVVALTGTFIGMVLAVQSYSQFRILHLESRLGAVINMSLVRELGPVLAATMLAGRVGSAMAAELGTMRITEQIDALAAMGANPIHYLVVPRFLSCLLLIPALTIMADFMGVVGGGFYGVCVLGIDSHHYWANSRGYVGNFDLFAGVFKSLFFGAAIALISCHRGFHCDPGAEGVGRAATAAFVNSFVMILLLDLFLAIGSGQTLLCFWPQGPRIDLSRTMVNTSRQPTVRRAACCGWRTWMWISAGIAVLARHQSEHRARPDPGGHRRERLRQDGAVEDDHRPAAAQPRQGLLRRDGTWPTWTSGN